MAEITIPDAMIRNRRAAYACCAADAGYEYVQARIYGDKGCQRKWKLRMEWLLWAQEAMVKTPTSTESTGKCFSHADACRVIQKADAICSKGCKCCGPTAAPAPPPDCSITPNVTVDVAIDAVDLVATQQANETLGFSIFVAYNSAGSGTSPNQYAIYDGATWVYTTATDGDIVLDTASGMYWVANAYPIWPALLFPSVIGDNNGGGNYAIVSEWPMAAAGSTRQVVVEMSTDEITWVEVFTGQESDLAVSLDLVLPQDAYTHTRVSYTTGGCTYEWYGGRLNENNPPSSARSYRGLTGSNVVVGVGFGSLSNPINGSFTMSFRLQYDPAGGAGAAYMQHRFYCNDTSEFTVEYLGGGEFFIFSSITSGLYIRYSIPQIEDGFWHHIAIVRSAFTVDDFTDVKVYIDGQLAAPNIIQLPTPYAPAAPVSTYEFTIADLFIDEIYYCDHPCSSVEVMTALRPNGMDLYDSSWGRSFWYRIEDPDTAGSVANFITPPKNSMTGVTPGAISTNVDPLIS